MLSLENVSISSKSWLMHKRQATRFQLQTQLNIDKYTYIFLSQVAYVFSSIVTL
jgi:hypothetical protein